MSGEEQQLVDALRHRLPSGLESLMEKYGNLVYGLVRRILAGAGRTEDVEECVSDVFLAAWKRIDEYDMTKGTLRTWLLILAKYAALDARRKLLRHQVMQSFDGHAAAAAGASVEENVITKEASAELLALVNALPEPDKSLFYRRYFFYESIEQISQGLNLTVKAVESRLYRLRKWFKVKLGERRAE
ncbi:sigma-70 family RNA polymerase sigma factor [Paenibacillus sp. PAMC21692]|uniref:sigma-70 family RNA polymerase sigma factor n=1 Tax=Paenibacillus sp. PAMC21692 TaxID=2762320 RepID=UPI00164D989D|nr:sigma-70 family RNA polymerase sigma factor [Paenibacillus sp. PAMC21692]QNK58823.1 sigma-70 family RNA polymerase sigma factor [Paenibacillus sp. PAMC21692]